MTDEYNPLLDAVISALADERGHLCRRDLPDGRYIAVTPLTFARGRIIIGRTDDPIGWDDGW